MIWKPIMILELQILVIKIQGTIYALSRNIQTNFFSKYRFHCKSVPPNKVRPNIFLGGKKVTPSEPENVSLRFFIWYS